MLLSVFRERNGDGSKLGQRRTWPGAARGLRSFATAVAASLMLAGCLVLSNNPVAPIGGHTPDPRLDGLWASTEGDTRYLVQAREDGWIAILGFDGGDGLDGIYWKAIPAYLGGQRYLSVRPIAKLEDDMFEAPPPKEDGFVIVRYDLDETGNRLTFSILDRDTVVGDIKAGGIGGGVENSRITDSTAALAAYVQSISDEKMDGPAVLVRVLDGSLAKPVPR